MITMAKGLLLMAGALCLCFWFLTQPGDRLIDESGSDESDLVNGESLFHAGGCASCHGAELEGGHEIISDFGTFRAPNISPDPVNGIGDWTRGEFLTAMKSGLSPDGRHYYPAFPYTSYTRMTTRDVLDLKAYIDSLPASGNLVADHDISFPWSVRRGIGLWKLLYLDSAPIAEVQHNDAVLERGRYLVEAVGHCGECHTPRDTFGGLEKSRWLAGGPNPDSDGKVPNITPHEDGIAAWPEKDIAYFLESGFTPDFDMVGSSMVEVQENLARISAQDRAAIAAYLKVIPALPKKID
jgi:mono/diheme cytochrome c family protein